MAKFQRSVVTGAGSGLGRGFVQRLAVPGAKILVSDVNVESGRQTVDLAQALGAEAQFFACDVRNPAAVDALRDAADEWMGGTDLMVNNAGVAVGGSFHEISLEDWKFCIDIDLWGVIYGCRAFMPQMLARGEGHIINVASAAGLLCSPQIAPYNVAKAGVIALSETMHAEYKGSGVNISVLCPTFFQTGIADAARAPEKLMSVVRGLMKVSRLSAEDVAQHAMDAVGRNQLYVVPMRDGRTMWRMKRLTPSGFNEVLRVVTLLSRKLKQ